MAFLIPSREPQKIPTGPNAAAVLDELCREAGMSTLSSVEITDLGPWTQSEAEAFERTVSEAFEHIEEAPRLP